MTVYQVKFNFYSHCSICRLESSYSPSTKEPERKRKELFSVNLDQPNHEKELNKVWGKMGFILPGWSEVLEHKMGGGDLPSHSLLFPSIFSPKTTSYQAANSDILLHDATKNTNLKSSLCHWETMTLGSMTSSLLQEVWEPRLRPPTIE